MPALSPTELAYLRASGHRVKLYLSVHKPRVLLSGLVNAVPARGATSIPYDTGTGSGFASIKAGHILKVVTATGVELVRVRSITGNQTSGTVTVAANGIVWADNQSFDILEDDPLSPLLPRFDSGGTFYKDGDITYAAAGNPNSQPPPVCIAGPHRAGFLEGGTVTFTFDLTDSYAVAKAATITDYSLTVTPSAGVTVTETSPGVFEVELTTAGQYWVEASCTDSNSKSQVTYRRAFVHDPSPASADYPYTDLAIELAGDWSRGGWALSMEVRGGGAAGATVSAEDFPAETLVVLWYEVWYGSSKVYVGGPAHAQNILFAGYIKRDSTQATWETSGVSFEAFTIEQWLKDILMRSISLAAKRAPSKWYEYALWLTPGRAIHHIGKFHSWLFEMADVYGLADSELGRKYAELQKNNLLGMMTEMALSLAAGLCCNKQGQLYFQQDLQYLNDAERDGAEVVALLVAGSDLVDITIAEQPPQVAHVTVTGLAFNGQTVAAYCAEAPGDVFTRRGAGEIAIDGQVLSNQTHANELAGRYYAGANNPYPEMSGQMQGIWLGALDVAEQVWWQIDLDGSETARGIVWEEQRLILRSVRASYDSRNGFLESEVTFEPEALGPVGVQMDCISDLPAAGEPGPPKWDTGGGTLDLGGTLSGLYATVDDGSGVYYRDDNDADWSQMDSTPVLAGEIDPWWMTGFRNATYNPAAAIIWQCQAGAIYRSPDGGNSWVDVTPVIDPPNAWSDATAPTVANLEFVCIQANMFVIDWFYVLARWENASGDWRGWLLWTSDNGVSWTWEALHTSDEVYPIWLSVSLGAGGNLWATYLRGTTLYLSKAHPLAPATFTETDLGAATVAEILAREKWAFPVSAYGDDNLVFVCGRMDTPAGLSSGIRHIISSTNGASSFSSVESGWGTDHCAAMVVAPDAGSGRPYYAVRQGN